MTTMIIFGKKNTANCNDEFEWQHQYALQRLTMGVLRRSASHSVLTRVCVSYLSTCSDMLLLVCTCGSREPTKF